MKSGKNVEKKVRVDGCATREHLLECAGKLIAQQGFAKTTSKEICKLAGENIAAINYHFGSRVGLYQELLQVVHQYLMDINGLKKLADSELTPREKLEMLLHNVTDKALLEHSWQVRLWIRELTNPSPYLKSFIADKAMQKGLLILQMVSEYTGLTFEDPKLYTALLGFGAPFAVLLLAQNEDADYASMMPIRIPIVDLIANLKVFAFAGLDTFKVK